MKAAMNAASPVTVLTSMVPKNFGVGVPSCKKEKVTVPVRRSASERLWYTKGTLLAPAGNRFILSGPMINDVVLLPNMYAPESPSKVAGPEVADPFVETFTKPPPLAVNIQFCEV